MKVYLYCKHRKDVDDCTIVWGTYLERADFWFNVEDVIKIPLNLFEAKQMIDKATAKNKKDDYQCDFRYWVEPVKE